MFWRKRSKRSVLVLGSGPAGLFAAAGAEDAGARVVSIISRGEKSTMYGAQYLHRAVPGLTEKPPVQIKYEMQGTLEGYRQKVYGEGTDSVGFQVSPERFRGTMLAWDIREAYDAAWERFKDRVEKIEVTPNWLLSCAEKGNRGLVWIFSISRHQQCYVPGRHNFISTEICAKGDAPGLGRWCPVSVAPNTVICNGEKEPAWYRASNVFGHTTAEWPVSSRPPISGVSLVEKPIRCDCTCWTDLGGAPVLRVGRYGLWLKSELSHRAYERAYQWLV